MIRWNGKRYVPAGVKPLMKRKGVNVPGMPKTKWIASWVGGESVPECDFTFDFILDPTPTPTQTLTSTATPTPTITSSSTPTPTPTATYTPTPTTSESGFDPDAAAYLADVIASGGTTDATIESAVDTLFTELKSNGLYTKIYAMYPYVGGTASSHAIEAKLNKSFDITWFGGMTHDISGSTGNAANGYGDTGFNPYVEIGSTGGIPSHSSIYIGTNTLGQYSEFGARDGSDNFIMAAKYGNDYYGWQYTSGPGSELTFNNPNSSGNYIQSRTGTTYAVVYKNGVSKNTKTYTETNKPPNTTLNVFYDSVIYSNRRLQFTTIGDGLSNSEILILDNIINTFQTSLGRNTY